MKPPVLIVTAPGTNRDREAEWACELAGGRPTTATMTELVAGSVSLDAFRMMVLPGGFSHGDDLGAGRMWALMLRHRLARPIERFVLSGRPIIGICNGFQALLKSGLLGSGTEVWQAEPTLTLTHNARGQFECRWVTLEPNPKSHCVFTRELTEPILCPVAHGEGRLVAADEAALERVEGEGRVTLRYCGANDEVGYPANPNGSANDIAGVCNGLGNVMGLMPHPEDHIVDRQHPQFERGESGRLGLSLFRAGVTYAGSC